MVYDVLIVGQGIAGSLLAWQMLKDNKKIFIIDNAHHASSTKVSGGLLNPLTGQRLVITPQYDVFYAHANSIYNALAATFGKVFITPKPIIRILKNNDEKMRCEQLMQIKEYAPYFKSIESPHSLGKSLVDPYGSVMINSGGYCHAQALLDNLKAYFSSKKVLQQGYLKMEDLDVAVDGVSFNGLKFKKVIFCEGFQAHANRFFDHLPYNHVKGEVLQVKLSAADLPDAIICQSKWLIPLDNGIWLAGSNYNRQEYNATPTPEAAYEIIQGLRQFIAGDIEIVAQVAGVRPVLIDQQPVVGVHPKYPSVGILNGLGSKGFLMAPFLATVLANYLNQTAEIPKEVDIKRFKC